MTGEGPTGGYPLVNELTVCELEPMAQSKSWIFPAIKWWFSIANCKRLPGRVLVVLCCTGGFYWSTGSTETSCWNSSGWGPQSIAEVVEQKTWLNSIGFMIERTSIHGISWMLMFINHINQLTSLGCTISHEIWSKMAMLRARWLEREFWLVPKVMPG